ncbi:MAG: hypothetical protein ACR2QK_21290, partial [Acidimicrobiales bacterium]
MTSWSAVEPTPALVGADRRLRVAQIITTLARGGAQATAVASADMEAHGIDVVTLAGPTGTDEGSLWD